MLQRLLIRSAVRYQISDQAASISQTSSRSAEVMGANIAIIEIVPSSRVFAFTKVLRIPQYNKCVHPLADQIY